MTDGDVGHPAAKTAAGAVGRRLAQRAPASLVSSWAGPITIIVALALVLAGCTGLMLLAGGAGSPPPGCEQSFTAPAGNDRILSTIRTVESGGRYEVRITTSTASGAYAFIDSTWRHYAASVGVDVNAYPSAWMAPHDAQDATANAYVNEILARNNNDVSAIPIAWYLPSALRNPALMDIVPAGGNVLTPRQYQQRWLTEYARQATLPPDPATTPTTPTATVTATFHAPAVDHTSCLDDLTAAAYTAPAGVTSLPACSISWGGYQPGRIPTTAMRYSRHSGYMHPAASAAWDQLWDAANRAGLDLNGYSYRPASQSSGASCSNHHWGLAIDVSAMVSPRFDTPEYEWLAANAANYGFSNPRFARPVSLGGTGRGGWAGGTCCHLEPWHWEFVAFLQLPPS